jgi:hypothetical protein
LVPSDTLSDLEIVRYKNIIGQIIALQKELVNCRIRISESGFNEADNNDIIMLRNSIKNNLELLPSIEQLQLLEINCSKDVFLETLIMAVKNSSLSHHHSFFKIRNARKKFLEKQLAILKQNFNANSGEILRCECDLNRAVEEETREEILKMRDFEQLNNEKITPYFLSLAKRPHCADNLGDIVKDDGSPFVSKQERDSYIKEHFASTYRRVPDTVNEQSINNFLGEVADHPEVQASKLNQEERDELELGLSIDEFDTAMEKAKLNTSPGIDAISNRFIKTFWYIFRKPLYDYAQCCYDKGILTENCRCAKIRLIPKKGDTSLLKNWRPISLLNCFYKLISRVVALRLKKVIDKITHVAQKGFSSTKYCQEVLIGLVDSINHLKFKKNKDSYYL